MANTLKFGNGEWYGKKDTILAYNDENNNYKPLPFDFSRASSATRVNKDGLIETVGSGQARIDFKDNTKGSLLLEPQRSNLVTYSEDFGNSYWSKSGSSITSNVAISPDGTLNADKLVENTNLGTHWFRRSTTVSNGKITFSIFAKKGERDYILLRENTLGGIYFDLTNGTIGGVYSNTPDEYEINKFKDGWYRCSVTFTVSNSTADFLVYTANIDNSNNYQGDGTSGVYIYGAQLEVGSYATSYIPTSGEANGVTRLADSCNNDFSVISTVANTNTVVLKFIPMGFDVDFAELLRFSDGTDEISLEGFSTNNYDMYGSGLTSSGMVDGALSLDAGSINTISFSYSGTSLRFSHNGSTINTTTPTGNLPTITEVSHSVGVLSPIKILDLRVYNDFKTQEELNTLTI